MRFVTAYTFLTARISARHRALAEHVNESVVQRFAPCVSVYKEVYRESECYSRVSRVDNPGK